MNTRKRQIILLVSFLLYFSAQLFHLDSFDTWRGELIAIPVLASGLLFGFKAALIFAFFILPINVLGCMLLDIDLGKTVLSVGGIAGNLTIMLCGCTIGYIRDLSARLQKELAQRSHAEKELLGYRDRLELEIEERTADLLEIKTRFEAVYNHHYQLTGLMDPEGRLLMGNKTALDFIGVSPEEVVGKYFWETPWWTHSPEEQQKIREAIDQALQGESVRFECVHVNVEGEKREIDFCITPVFDDNGKILYLVPEGYDITERKRAEDAFRENEAKYRTFFENSCDAMQMLQNGRWIDCNKATATMLGYDNREELVNMSPWQVSPEHQSDGTKTEDKGREMIRIALARGTHRFEWEHEKKDGSTLPVEVSLTAMPEHREFILLAVFRDISEQKRAEQERARLQKEIIQAQKMESIGTLAGGIAHDFNNILGAIMGYTELSLEDVKDMPTTHGSLNQVLRAADRAKDLVRQILTFSRSTTINKTAIRIIPIVKEVCKLLRATLPVTIEIRQDIATTNDLVMADVSQIHQVLMNLCTNAGYAMKEKGGVLEVSMKEYSLGEEGMEMSCPGLKVGAYLELTIKDTGSGISPEAIERIFEPYFTTKSSGEGTGLGLAVVHGIVKEYGGDIKVYSETGKGSVFHVLFPLVQKDADTEEEKTLAPIPTGTETILFVDDEENLLATGKQILSRLGYKVITASSSEDAVETFGFTHKSYDLLITDKTMPGMSGYELARALRTIRPDLPVIICSGFFSKNDTHIMAEDGIEGYIAKPIDRRNLAEAIRRVLDGTGE